MIVRTKIATALSVALFAVTGTASAEVTLYDYTEATSAYQDAYVTGQFNATDGNGHDQTAYNANLTLDYDRVISSPNRNLGLTFNADGTLSRGSGAGASSDSNYLAIGSVTADNYFQPNSKGLFWYGSGEAGLKKSADLFSKIGVGLGYGRVVNVTPMAIAIRMIEALRKQGSLAANPSKATYLKIAQIISREDEYQSKFRLGNYEQEWITDIEKALVASGQVRGALTAAGVIVARDVLINERISSRKHGWLVRGGFGLVLSNYDGTDGGDPSLDLGAEYHRPLDNDTQFSNVAKFSSIFGDDDTGYRVSNNMSFTRELSDRVDWENNWLLDYSKAGDDAGQDLTTNTLSSTFRYYLNNQLDLTATAKATNTEDDIDNNGNDDTDLSFNVGASYRLR